MESPRKYRPSLKREKTSERIRQRVKQAAWAVFARDGLDAASIAAIVAESATSTGSFYNHFRTKQAVFDELLADLVGQVRRITAAARAQADAVEPMLRLSYKALLDHILSLDGALPFIARNQHHIRAKLYALDGTGALLEDVRHDLLRGMPDGHIDPDALSLVASLIVSNGIETLLLLDMRKTIDTTSIAALMTRIMARGIEGVAAASKT